MKKIKLSLYALNLGDNVLGRDELKKISGGWVYCAGFDTWCPDGYLCNGADGSCIEDGGGGGGGDEECMDEAVRCIVCYNDSHCNYKPNLFCDTSSKCPQYEKVCRRIIYC